MTIPANNIANGTVGSLEIDHKIVSATVLSNLATQVDLGADYSSEFTAPINGQRTSTVLVRVKPTLALSDMPAEREGLLARTSISGGSVEIGLKDDKYFKVAVDGQGVTPGTVEVEIGTAGAEAIARHGNKELLATLEADGAPVAFGRTFSASNTTAQHVWDSLLTQVTAFREAELTEHFILYIRPAVWGKLVSNVEALKVATDQNARAAQLLGVEKVHVINLTETDSLAVFAHRGAVAQAKVLSGIRSAVEDFDTIVEGRIKVGSKVLDASAVAVIKDGTAPAEG